MKRKILFIYFLSILLCGCNISRKIEVEISTTISQKMQKSGCIMMYAQMDEFSGCSVHILDLHKKNFFGISGIMPVCPKNYTDFFKVTKQIEYYFGPDSNKINTIRIWERYDSDVWSPIYVDAAKSIPLGEKYFNNFNPNRKGLAIAQKYIKIFNHISDHLFGEEWNCYKGVTNPIKQYGYAPAHLRKYKSQLIIIISPNYNRFYEAYITEKGWSFLRCISFDANIKMTTDEDPDKLLEQLYQGWREFIIPFSQLLTTMGEIK